jgi:hypothetical protein
MSVTQGACERARYFRPRACGRIVGAVVDLGPPIAYTALREGVPVFDPHGHEIGVVEEVVGDLQADIFDGLLIHTEPLPGRHVFAAAGQIAELHERGVLLSVGRDALRDPPGTRRPRDDAPVERPLHAWLRHAWDRLAGRR